MNTESVQVLSAFLSLATLCATGITVAALVAGPHRRWAREVRAAVVDLGAWPVFVVTFGSMVGSLYFSEVANFAPCRLCWYQRIAMYPLALLSLVAALRRDRRVMPYFAVLASVGFVISVYHYLLEWFPRLESGVCSVDVPCTAVWFREFGFVSLAFMAGSAFLATVVWSCVIVRADNGRGTAD